MNAHIKTEKFEETKPKSMKRKLESYSPQNKKIMISKKINKTKEKQKIKIIILQGSLNE